MRKHLQFLLLLAALLLPWATMAQAYSYTCTFENASDTAGWVFVNGTQNNKWVIGTAAHSAGSKGMYISNNGTANDYTVSGVSIAYAYREVTIASAASYAFQYDWKAKGESNYDYLRVWLAPASATLTAGQLPNGTTTMSSYTTTTPAGWISLDGGGKLNLVDAYQTRIEEISLNAGTYKLIFMWGNDASGGTTPPASIDNVSIVQSLCSRPTRFAAVPQSATDVLLTWHGTSPAYVVEYSASPFTPGSGAGTVINTTDTSLLLTGLAASTLYYAYVHADCGTATSINASVSFTTPCAPIAASQLPYTYGFEDATGSGATYQINSCWGRHTNSTTAYPYPSTTQKRGTKSLYFSNTANGASYSYVVLPMFDTAITSLQVSFWLYKTSANYGHMKVGVIVNPDDISTFTPLANVQPSAVSTWEQFEVPLVGYQGNGRFIAFVANDAVANYVYLDDVEVSAMPSCPKPVNAEVLVALNNSATIAWQEIGTAASWDIEYGPAGFARGQGTSISATSSSVTLNGLTANTTYDFYIQSVCSSESSQALMGSFRTACDPIALTDMPYTYGFEDATGTGGTANINACWGRHTNYSTAYPYPSSTQKRGNYALYFYNTANGANYSYLTLPMLEAPLSSLQVSFWLYKTSANYGHIKVGVMTNPGDLSTFTTVADLQPSTASVWEYFEVPLNTYRGTGRYIAFVANDAVLNYTYLDDVTVDFLPTCPRPTDLVVSNVAAESVDLSWTENGSASEWQIEWGPYGFEPGQGTIEQAYDTTYTLYGLSPSSSYSVRITAVCGYDDSSTVLAGDFATLCGEVELPFTYGFENAATGTSAQFPNCWRRHNDASGTYNYFPYVNTSSTNAHGGTKYLYFYQSTTSTYAENQYVILPPVNTDSYPMAYNELLFWAKPSSTTAGELIVGVMTNPDSVNTFEPVDTLTITTGAYDLYTVRFSNYADTGKYIAIRGRRLGSSVYTYVDDITVRVAASCPSAQNIRTAGVSIDTCAIAWDATEDHSLFMIYYGTPGFSIDTALFVTSSDSTATIFGLMPDTEYEYCVESYCFDGTVSNLSPRYTFVTACSAIPADSLPYVENFERYASGATNPINHCWTRGTNSTVAYPYPYSSAAINGGLGLYFYGYRSSTLGTDPTYSYAALPLFETPVTDMRLRFKMRRYNSTTATNHSMVRVGVMTNPNDINTFETIQDIDLTQEIPNSIHDIEVNFDSYTGNGSYLAIYAYAPATTSHYNYVHIDDVIVDLIPSCRRSENLAVDSITAYSAMISWTNGSDYVSGYTVALGTTADFNPATATDLRSASDTTLLLTGLNDYTTYYWAVRADCGSDSSEWSRVSRFTTLLDCGPRSVNIQDTLGTGSSATSTYTMYPSTTYPTAYSRNIFTAQELNEMGLQTNNRINSISIHAGATGGTINDVSIYLVETDLNEFSSTAANDTVAPAGMTRVFHGNITVTPTQWLELPFDSAFVYSGTRNLMVCIARNGSCSAAATFYYTSTTPRYSSCYGYRSSATVVNNTCTRTYCRTDMAFNICTEIPACVRPTEVALSNLRPTVADIAWTGSSAAYEYAYGVVGFDPESAGTHAQVAVNAVSLTSLSAATSYDFYVRGICGADTSDWSMVYSFRTPCMPQALPYTENFEAYGTGSTQAISSCWVKGTNNSTAYPYPFATNAINGTRSLYFYAYHPSTATSTAYYSYAALPLMAAPVDSLTLTFNMRRYSTTTASYTSRLVVGLMTDPSDIATFTPVDTIDLKDEAALSVHGVEVNFAGMVNQGQYIALYDEVPPFYTSGTAVYSYLYVDDISVDYTPTCPAPVNIHVIDSTVGTTTVEVDWTDRIAASLGYELEYGPAGYAQGTGTVLPAAAHPVLISGLTPGTQYDVYVRALCSADDQSPWSFPVSFATECETIASLPVTYTFDDQPSGTAAQFPLCWNRFNNASGTYNYYPYVYNSSTYAHSGTQCLYFYASTSTTYAENQLAVLPAIDTLATPMNSLEVVFWGRGSSTTSYDASIVIGVMSDSENLSSFVPVDTVVMNATLTEYTVPFTAYTGNGNRIAFRKDRASAAGYAYIDDITIEEHSECDRPYDLEVVNVTSTDATIDWTDTIGASHWSVEYSVAGSDNPTVVEVYAHPVTLAGLMPSTTYSFRVAAHCPFTDSRADYSRESRNFTTAQIPAALPYTFNFEDSTEWVNWQTASNQPVNWFRGTTEAYDGTHSIYVSADNGATRSTNMNQIVNAVAYRDIQFDTVPGSYQVNFKVNVGGTQAHNYDGVAVVLVDPAQVVESSATGLTSPWGHVNDIAISTFRRTNGWQDATVYLDNVSGVQRLAFYWFNQATGADDFAGGPAAIDSLVVRAQECPRPSNLQASALTETSAMLSWDGTAALGYQIAYRVYGAAASTNIYIPVATNSYNLTGLDANTQYIFWVRALCDTATVSAFSLGETFTTVCSIYSASDTLFEDFRSVPGVAYNVEGTLPDCWEGYSNGTDAKYMPHVVNSGTYWYSLGDSNSLVMTSGSSATQGNTKIVRLPMFSEPVNSLTVSFWMCTEGSAQGTLSVGYMTGDDYANDFVSVKDIPATTASQHSGTGPQQSGRGIFDSVSFDSVPANALYLAFKWYHNSTFYSVCLDNIKVTTDVSCVAPVITAVSHDYQSATATWSGNGTAYEVAIKATAEANWSSEIPVSANTYTFNALQPATSYTLRVRQDCSVDSLGYSTWSEYTFTTDSLPCLAPESLAFVSATNATATFSWTARGTETAWDIRVYNGTYDSVYTVTAQPATVGGLTAGVTYNAAIRALCGTAQNIEGAWSDSILFSTSTCPNPTNLQTSNVTATSVTLSWSSDPSVSTWIIEYGYLGTSQGQGTMLTVTTNPYTVTGLESETSYQFAVRAQCAPGWMSEGWSNMAMATTDAEVVPCDVPADLTVNVPTVASMAPAVTVTWTGNSTAANGYEVELVPQGMTLGQGVQQTTTNTYCQFTGLTDGTSYTVYVRSNCDATTYSAWANATFSTLAFECDSITGLTATVQNDVAQLNWNAGSNNTGAWEYVYGLQGQVNLATANPVAVNTTTVTLTGLTRGADYEAYVRAVCDQNHYTGWSTVSFHIDTIVTPTCDPVTGLTASEAIYDEAANAFTTTVSWTGTASSYEIDYGTAGFNHANGTTATTANSNYTVAGLAANGSYDIYVRAICEEGLTSLWERVTVTTGAIPGSECAQVTGVSVSVEGNEAAITWNAVENAESYEVEYGTVGFSHDAGIAAYTTTDARYVLQGLENNNYQVYVRANCGNDNYGEWSEVATFAVNVQGIEEVESSFSCTVYPNPATSATTISVMGANGKVRIAVVDINGRTVASETMECSGDCEKTMNVDNLAQGAYFVRVTGESVNMVKKLIVR